MKILLSGGGTGGHIYPALALADHFQAAGATVAYIGLAGGPEQQLVPAAGFRFTAIPAAPWRRKLSPALVEMLRENLRGIQKASAFVREFSPDAILATGGYVSFPAITAGWLSNRRRATPIFLGLLEPNAVPGLTNRLLAPLVDEIWGSYTESAGRFAAKFIETGVPVRAAFDHPPSRVAAAAELGIDPQRPTILVIGGSQGARSLNTAVTAMLHQPLPPQWQVVLISGPADYAQAFAAAQAAISEKRAAVFSYLENPLAAYVAADIVVARAGASTIAELARLGKAALFVPYPYATDNHQERNAQAYIAAGAGAMLLDCDLNAQSLRTQLEMLLDPPQWHALLHAAQKLAMLDASAAIGARVRQAILSPKRRGTP